MLKSGVHAALAGVALALAIPLNGNPAEDPPLTRVEHELAPWVAFGILPLFGFANAGLSFAKLPPSSLLKPVPLAIAAGLSLGKQIGVFGSAALVIGRGWAEMPNSASWAALYGTSILTGIGFTMSLFIGTSPLGKPTTKRRCDSGCFSVRRFPGSLGQQCSVSQSARANQLRGHNHDPRSGNNSRSPSREAGQMPRPRGDVGRRQGPQHRDGALGREGLRWLLIEAGIDLARDGVTIAPVPGASGPGVVNFGVTAAKELKDGRIEGFWANGLGAEVAVCRGVGTIVLDVRRGDGPKPRFN